VTLATCVTAAGLFCGVLGVGLWPHAWWLLIASLLFDAIDGHVARETRTVTPMGAALDWSTDCALSHAIVWRCFPLPVGAGLSFLLAVFQAARVPNGTHLVSGRAAVTLVALAVSVFL